MYGPVAKLIQVKDIHAATALEVAAGGRVRNEMSSLTLQCGFLKLHLKDVHMDSAKSLKKEGSQKDN